MKNKRRQSVGGAVLIMILTVMFVLIIMLMATLTVVSTAGQRIYTKYEENQAYYSARSALDVFIAKMLADKDYYAVDNSGTEVVYNYGSGENAKMKQGLALQLDLYKLEVTDRDGDGVVDGENIEQSALMSYANGVGDKDEYKIYFGTDNSSSDIQLANPTDPDSAQYIEYEITYFPKTSNGSDQYGVMLDYESPSSTVPEKATIRVEVLGRTYNVDETVVTAKGYTDRDAMMQSGNDADIAEAIAKGSRKKDKMKVKITSTVDFMGVTGTAVVIFDTNEPPANNSSRAITAFGGTGSDNMSIFGGMSAQRTINWGNNDGYIYGPVYVEDDFLMTSNGPKIYLGSGENLVVGGDLQLSNSGHFEVSNITSPLLVDDSNAPLVYVGGEIRVTGGTQNPFKNMDVIAEKLNVTSYAEFDSSSRIYCKDFISNAGSNSKYNSDIYVDGDVTIYNDNDTKITYNDEGVATSVVHGGTGTIHFTGKVLDGNKGGADVTGAIGAGFVEETESFWDNIPTEEKIQTIPDKVDKEKSNEKIEFSLPGRTNKKNIETHIDSFGNYYVKDEDGKLNMISVTENDPVTGLPVTVSTPEIKSAQTMADIDTMTDKTKPFTEADTGITDTLSALCAANPPENFAGGYFQKVLDTAGGAVKCQWDFDNQNIRIKGGGTVVLLLSRQSYSNDNVILVDDDTTLKIVGDTTSSNLWFGKIEVYNQTTWGAYKGQDAGKGIDPLKVGSVTGAGIKVPKIYYYFTGNGKLQVQNNCLMTGYVYGPSVELDFPAASTPSPNQGMQYNGASVSGKPVCIVGSALVKGATLPNNTGVAYINPALADDGDAGEPIHNWLADHYARN